MSIRDRADGSPPADPPAPTNIDDILDARALRIDRDQATTAGQKAQGLENLGATVNSDGKLTLVTADGTFSTFLNLEP